MKFDKIYRQLYFQQKIENVNKKEQNAQQNLELQKKKKKLDK